MIPLDVYMDHHTVRNDLRVGMALVDRVLGYLNFCPPFSSSGPLRSRPQKAEGAVINR